MLVGDKKVKACRHLNIVHATRDVLECDFRTKKQRIRGTLPARVLAAIVNALKDGTVTDQALLTFLEGGDVDSNLVRGQEPITLRDLLYEHYLPKAKKPVVAATTYGTALDEAKRLVKTLGNVLVHELRPSHQMKHKEAQQALGKANVSTKHDLQLLGQAVDYAVRSGRIKNNLLLPVTGLPTTDRTSIWLRLPDIVKLLRNLPSQIKALAYFLILTGARISEALQVTVADIDWTARTIRIPNAKRRRKTPSRAPKYRTVLIDDLGPRFEWLIKKIIKPDPISGHLFPGRFPGRPLDKTTAEDLIHEGVMRADLEHLIPPEVVETGGRPHFIPHDCRGTMVNHGLLAGWPDQKLRAYLGQRHGESIRSYRDEADSHDPAGSIYVHPPLRLRRARAGATPAPVSQVAEAVRPYAAPTASQFLN